MIPTRPRTSSIAVNWTAVTSLITALTALGALVFTGLSLNTARAQLAAVQSYISSAEQGQFTDRYSRAVEQIGQQGADHLQIRLGGIYSLERLARDSPRDQPTILEVLSAFVRTNTMPAGNCPDQPTSPDVQAALTVAGRRDAARDNGTHIDLHGACLRNAQLGGANLAHANLEQANLMHAHFERANLRDANLSNADISNAVFTGADLSDAKLERTDFSDADFSEANLSAGNLRNADARHAILIGAILNKTDLRGANLSGANLRDVDLRGADLRNAEHNESPNHDGVVTDSNTQGIWW